MLDYNIRSVYYTSLAVILDVQIIVLGKQQNSSVEQREAASDAKAFPLVGAGQPQRVGQDVVG